MAEEKDQTQVLATNSYGRAVTLGADLDYSMGDNGDYRVVSAILSAKEIKIYEAVSGTDRYPPGRNMHVSLSAEEFGRLVQAYQQLLAEQEEEERRQREARTIRAAGVAGAQGDDYDPFLDEGDLP